MSHGGPPILGMILPGSGQGLAEAQAMYPDVVQFRCETVGLQSMTGEGYDAVVDRIVPVARMLAEQGADAIILMGTSLSFFRGPGFNAEMRAAIADATGRPALTMSDAIVDGLRELGGHRVAAATAYGDEVNALLRSYLELEGFNVRAVCGLGIASLTGGDLDAVSTADVIALGVEAMDAADDADVLLVSCGGLRTLDALQPLEERTGRPVVSSFPHALRAGLRLLGVDARLSGHGRLLDS